MQETIKVDMIDAIKVQFLKPIFEDDFTERGMKAWLTGVDWEWDTQCYKLHFDFSEFEDENDKYFRRTYWGPYEDRNNMRTAKEVGMYNAKYSVYVGISSNNRNDALFAEEILDYLRVIE